MFFFCFTVSVLEIFLVMQVTREEARLVTSKAMTTCNLTPLANAVVEIPPLITADVIRLVSTIPVIVLNRFCFFLHSAHELQFHQKNIPQFHSIYLINMLVVLVVLKGLDLDKFWFYCRIRSLFI